MVDLWQEIRDYIREHDSKRAEISIGRLLRTDLSPLERARIHIYRAQSRLLTLRPDEALDDIHYAEALFTDILKEPFTQEAYGDAYLQRFETASAGFADKTDVQRALSIYEILIQKFPDYDNLGWIYYQLGRAALVNNTPDEARDAFYKGLFNPSNVKSLTAYCYERLAFIALYEDRRAHYALTMIDKAIDTYPSKETNVWLVQAHLIRTKILREINIERTLASARFTTNLAASDNSFGKGFMADILFSIAEIYSKCQGYERDTVTTLQQFCQTSRRPVGVDVTWSRAHEMLGDAHYALSAFDSALHAYELCLHYNPDHPWGDAIRERITQLAESKK
jgi:tetratricopeptide (TPR) repeat protein